MGCTKLGHVFSLLIIISLVCISFGCAPKPASPTSGIDPSTQPLRIVSLEGVTGYVASTFAPMLAAFDDKAKEINEQGGVNGHPIEIEIIDTRYDVKITGEQYQRVITQDRKPLIMTLANSTWLLSNTYRLEEDQIPCFASPAKGITSPPGWVFSAALPYFASLVGGWYQWAVKDWESTKTHPGKMKVAFLSWDNTLGRGMDTTEANAYAESLGIDIVAKEYFSLTSVSMMENLLRVKNANPDWILTFVNPQHMYVIMRDAIDLGLVPPNTRWAASVTAADQSLQMLAPDEVKIVQPVALSSYPSWDEKDDKMVLEAERFFVKYNRPEEYKVFSYLAGIGLMDLFAQAFKLVLEDIGYENLDGAEIYEILTTKLEYKQLSGLQVDYKDGKRDLSQMKILRWTPDVKLLPLTGFLDVPDLRPVE